MADGWFGSLVAWVTDKPDVVWSGIGIAAVSAVGGAIRWVLRRKKPEIAALVQSVPHNTVVGATGTMQNVTAGGNVTVNVGMTPDQAKELVGAVIDATIHDRIHAATEEERRRAAEAEARARQSEEQLAKAVKALDDLRSQIPGQAPGIDSALAALREGRTGEAETLFTEVLAAHEAAGREQFRAAAAAARHLGSLAFLHNTQKALAAYHKAVDLDPEDVDGWNRLGHLLVRIGELEKAARAYERVLSLGTRNGDRAVIAIATGNFGLIHRLRGDLAQAEEAVRKALALEEELGRKEGMASQYGNLGVIHASRGELDQAEEFFSKSLALEEELGRKEGMANDYGNLGLIHQRRGNFDRAETFHLKALGLEEELGRKEGMATEYGNLGLIHRKRGNLDCAEEFHLKALALEEELGRKSGVANQYGNLGIVFEDRRDRTRAAEYYRKALALFRQVGMAPEIAQIEESLNRIDSDIPPP